MRHYLNQLRGTNKAWQSLTSSSVPSLTRNDLSAAPSDAYSCSPYGSGDGSGESASAPGPVISSTTPALVACSATYLAGRDIQSISASRSSDFASPRYSSGSLQSSHPLCSLVGYYYEDKAVWPEAKGESQCIGLQQTSQFRSVDHKGGKMIRGLRPWFPGVESANEDTDRRRGRSRICKDLSSR